VRTTPSSSQIYSSHLPTADPISHPTPPPCRLINPTHVPQAVMTSSIRAYEVLKNNYSASRTQRWTNALINSGNTPFDQGYNFEGVFTISVCKDPPARCLSTLKSNKGRHYPCQCGCEGDYSETQGFLEASGMARWQTWVDFCADAKQEGCIITAKVKDNGNLNKFCAV